MSVYAGRGTQFLVKIPLAQEKSRQSRPAITR